MLANQREGRGGRFAWLVGPWCTMHGRMTQPKPERGKRGVSSCLYIVAGCCAHSIVLCDAVCIIGVVMAFQAADISCTCLMASSWQRCCRVWLCCQLHSQVVSVQ